MVDHSNRAGRKSPAPVRRINTHSKASHSVGRTSAATVNRRVASSNLARGANFLFNQLVRDCSFSAFGDRSKNVVSVLGFPEACRQKRRKTPMFLRKRSVERPNPSVRNRTVGQSIRARPALGPPVPGTRLFFSLSEVSPRGRRSVRSRRCRAHDF